MLESESCYLPVLSEPSSGSSSPQVHREDLEQKQTINDMTKPRRIVANFGGQSVAAAALQHCDAVIHPTKSTLQPKSHDTAIRRCLRSPLAQTLCLDSSDTLESTVADGVSTSCVAELRRLSDVKRKLNEDGTVALSSMYTPEKYRDTMRQIYGDDNKRSRSKQSSGGCCDTNSRTTKHHNVLNSHSSVVQTANVANRDPQGKSTSSSQHWLSHSYKLVKCCLCVSVC